MKRLIPFLLAWAFLPVGAVDAVPARPLYSPAPVAKAPTLTIRDLRGTAWFGQDFVENFHLKFEADGTLSYGYKGTTNRNGSWTQQGNSVYFEMNKKYREFKGEIQGDSLVGESWNVTGKHWQTKVRLVSSDQ